MRRGGDMDRSVSGSYVDVQACTLVWSSATEHFYSVMIVRSTDVKILGIDMMYRG
jgi:hypothetical protein